MPGYPIELELGGKVAVVVGLGAVGRRKASGLLAAGAIVVGIDPAAGIMPEGVRVVAEPYEAAHLLGAALAFAAATAEVNRRVVADARAAGVWVNSASGSETGDFTLPAVYRDGPMTLSVSTAGASPALAALLRDRAAEALGPAAGGLAALLTELRPIVLAKVEGPDARRTILASWADARWLDLWDAEGPEAVRRRLLEALEVEEGGPS